MKVKRKGEKVLLLIVCLFEQVFIALQFALLLVLHDYPSHCSNKQIYIVCT